MPQTHIVAILSPAQGKSQRLKDLLGDMCKDVHKKEDYTLRYIATERIDQESADPDIIMIETYKDKESADKHTTEDHFKEIFAALEKEKVLGKEPFLAKTQSKHGFDLDRNLI